MKNADVRFECPRCGSSDFGYGKDIGYCHGDYSCEFKWPRSDEWKYFVLVQEHESPEEYGIGEPETEEPKKEATHIFCDGCQQIRPVIWDELQGRDVSGKYAGTDGVCSECKLVVVTVYQEPS